jgi:hypothetical protein
MRVLCCGSRSWTDVEKIHKELDRLIRHDSTDIVVVHGDQGADAQGNPLYNKPDHMARSGADKLSGRAASMLGLPVERHPADWRRHGKAAGYKRNIAMLESGIDLVLAFWDGESPGTAHTIREASKRRIPVEIYRKEHDGRLADPQ